jgi:hypothetical protein
MAYSEVYHCVQSKTLNLDLFQNCLNSYPFDFTDYLVSIDGMTSSVLALFSKEHLSPNVIRRLCDGLNPDLIYKHLKPFLPKYSSDELIDILMIFGSYSRECIFREVLDLIPCKDLEFRAKELLNCALSCDRNPERYLPYFGSFMKLKEFLEITEKYDDDPEICYHWRLDIIKWYENPTKDQVVNLKRKR